MGRAGARVVHPGGGREKVVRRGRRRCRCRRHVDGCGESGKINGVEVGNYLVGELGEINEWSRATMKR
jgi:hypothetical protein